MQGKNFWNRSHLLNKLVWSICYFINLSEIDRLCPKKWKQPINSLIIFCGNLYTGYSRKLIFRSRTIRILRYRFFWQRLIFLHHPFLLFFLWNRPIFLYKLAESNIKSLSGLVSWQYLKWKHTKKDAFCLFNIQKSHI